MSGQSNKDINSIDINENISTAFDVEAFDEAIRAHGVEFVHYRSMRNPGGLVDKHDHRRPDDDHTGASNGFLYTKAGTVTAIFTANNRSDNKNPAGLMNEAKVGITTPRFYDNKPKESVLLAPYDRLFLKEKSILVSHWQLVQAHITGNDRLDFPAVKILDIVDSRNKRYLKKDYCIKKGNVVWKTQNQPGIDPETGKGRIYSIRYQYRPHWYVDTMQHEIRVAQMEDAVTGERGTVMMPQRASLQREYVFLNENKSTEGESKDSPRQVKSPDYGSFGAR